ncbi:MAG: type II toxin-antitoxin system VapC family toxin [Chloroflexi bacterium]|nr:type II toxin-antitoxin system VapC family toxin [Chloroflexota bacterium]
MNKPLVIYWDSCAFIHCLQNSPVHAPSLKEHVEQARRGQCRIATAAVSLAEVCKLPEAGVLPEEQTEKILAFLKNDYILLYQIDRDIGESAHQIIRAHGLKPMDALHVAAALAAKADFFITTDTHKYRRDSLVGHSGKIGIPPLKIELPNTKMFHPLFNT